MRWEAGCRWLALLLLLSFDLANLATAFLETKDVEETPLYKMEKADDTIDTAVNDDKLGVCSYTGSMVSCKQFDADGKNKLFEAEASVGGGAIVPRKFDMMNLEKGLMAAMIVLEKKDAESAKAMAVLFDDMGKKVKVIDLGVNVGDDGAAYVNLYKNKNGEPCVMGLFWYFHSKAEDPHKDHKFAHANRCFTKEELA